MLARGELARQKVRTIFPYLKLPERIARDLLSGTAGVVACQTAISLWPSL